MAADAARQRGSQRMTSPLAGVLVADFSRVLAGPLATMHLADMGATVVKVERPGTGDDTRAWGPPWTRDSSSYFECVNRSKYSVTLDLADPDDRAAAIELSARADVLVENFRPGSLAQYGLDYDTVEAGNPGIVYCSISGFGSGDGAARPGYDFLVQAMGGLMSITGDPDGEPTKVGVALVDVLTGKDAVIGILAALAVRQRSGIGDHIEVDLLSSLLGGLANQASNYLTTGRAPARMGNQHPSIAPYETLRCADAPIAVACGNDTQFRRLTTVLGRPTLADDPRFATNPARVEHRRALVEQLESCLAVDSAAVWEQRLTAVGVPAGLVGDIGSAIAQAAELGLEPLVELGRAGRAGHAGTPQIRHPVRYARSRVAEATPPPGLGEHTDTVRRWLASSDGRLVRRAHTELG
jgi:crotonobetainyl-CoA:carnitine CoA-transferase CaiB-like acyl-CoA transferase